MLKESVILINRKESVGRAGSARESRNALRRSSNEYSPTISITTILESNRYFTGMDNHLPLASLPNSELPDDDYSVIYSHNL